MANDPLTPGSIDWSDLTYYHLEEGEMFWFSKNPNTMKSLCVSLVNNAVVLNMTSCFLTKKSVFGKMPSCSLSKV